jgi:hypothetical protein
MKTLLSLLVLTFTLGLFSPSVNAADTAPAATTSKAEAKSGHHKKHKKHQKRHAKKQSKKASRSKKAAV